MGRVLAMLEVSKKQAYIFSSNLLRDNAENSTVISWVTSPAYMKEVCGEEFEEEKNLVYAGGGHMVLEFPSKEAAKMLVGKVTKSMKAEFPELEVFVKLMEYDPKKEAGENLEELSRQMEAKKSLKVSMFRQGSFGIEKLDSNSHKPVLWGGEKKRKLPQSAFQAEKRLEIKDYQWAYQFEKLGTSKGKSSFIAVIHIDGNGMGKRVREFRRRHGGLSWEDYKKKLREFSDEVDDNFKSAFLDMEEIVIRNLEAGNLEALSLEGKYLPLRPIINAGDDVCFVTEGRVGLECAALLLKRLAAKENQADGQGACAGVAIVHQKYPFYRAYELSEELCANAKAYAASLGKASVIDWHLEHGECKDTLEEIREEYQAQDGSFMLLRPYLVCGEKAAEEQAGYRRYENFRKLMKVLQNEEESYAAGKLKELRIAIRGGIQETDYFIRKNLLGELGLTGYQGIYKETDPERIGTGQGQERKLYADIDGRKHSLLFDALEAMDLFLKLDEEGGDGA